MRKVSTKLTNTPKKASHKPTSQAQPLRTSLQSKSHSSPVEHAQCLTMRRIKNPLASISHEQLTRDVENFAKENGLTDITPMLIKGAFVAKDPPAFESVEGLTEDEKEAIRNEVLHKWRQPKSLFFTIILCSIGAAVQGWDQTGSNGANLSFPVAFDINDAETLPDGSPNPDRATNLWLVGLINAGPYIASAFFGCWISDPLNFYFGRRGTIFFSAAVSGTFSLWSV